MLAALLFTAVAIVGLVPLHGLPPQSAGASSAAPVNCPGGVAQCVTLSAPCSSRPCLTVTAGPTENVGIGQYVFLDLSNFPPGDTVRVAYCPTTDPVTIVADPQCAQGPFLGSGTNLSPSVLPVQADGTVQASFPTEVDASGESNVPISANQLVTTVPPPPPATFFCDNGPDYCAIEVTDDGPGESNPDATAANTIIIPLTFAASSNGCPASDPLLFTDSAFSVEHFIPAAVDSTCSSSSGVAVANTATNTEEVVSDFAAGGSQIVFTDDPNDPVQLAAIQGQQYTFIPVAVSATVVAFLAGDSGRGVGYPVSSYDLTPNMVAGLITSNYTEPNGSDVLIPPLECAQIAGCSSSDESNYDAFDLLNPAPAGLSTPGQFGLSFSSVASGASYQVTDWLCHAPNVPFTVSVPLKTAGASEPAIAGSKRTTTTTTLPAPSPVTVTDPHQAASTFTTAPAGGIAWPPLGDPDAAWPYPKCDAYPVLPVLSASGTQYAFAQTPAAQALDIRKFAYGGGGEPVLQGPVSLAAFGAMDWSEAAYAGLQAADLQNAAGNFVGPSASSIDAALGDATEGSNGVLSYNYNNTSDADAYPMPQVTYALVSTAPQSASASQAEGDLLANLLSYSHSGGSIPLPPGYVPLPDNLYNQAIAQVTKIFPTAVIPTSSSSSSSSSSSASGSRSSGSGLSSSTAGGVTGVGGEDEGTTASAAVSATTPTTVPAQARRLPPLPPGFDPVILAALTGKDGWILPGLVGVTLLLLLVGPLLYGAPRLRRRLARAKETEA